MLACVHSQNMSVCARKEIVPWAQALPTPRPLWTSPQVAPCRGRTILSPRDVTKTAVVCSLTRCCRIPSNKNFGASLFFSFLSLKRVVLHFALASGRCGTLYHYQVRKYYWRSEIVLVLLIAIRLAGKINRLRIFLQYEACVRSAACNST